MNLPLARVNNLLTAAIIVINGYVILLPLYPMASFWWAGHNGHRQQQLTSLVTHPSHTSNSSLPEGEHLVIPRLLMDEPIYEGQSVYTVNKGVWRWPKSSTPNKLGNTVLIGHRFTYGGPAVFYHLDLIKVNDPVVLLWNKRQFSYKVTAIKVVSPNDPTVEAQTNDSRLTIYTCTPLWSTKNRLVVVAERSDQ